MDLELGNRVALVLGAGGGLGRAIARTIAAEGAKVAVADINMDAATATADAISASGGTALPLPWDIAALDQVDAQVGTLEEALGPVDILIAITGGPPPSTVSGQPADVWQSHFNSMVLSVISITDRLLPGMVERGWGRILTSTSSGVIAPIPNLGLSNALRSTLVGWSKTLAGEVGKYGVTSNIIVPGRIATQRITFLDEKKAEREGRKVEDVRAESVGSIPRGRYGDPQEYADAAAFLVSARAGYITGSMIRVDGGYLANI